MSRSWRITLVFGLGLAAVFAAMGWITVLGLRLERSEAQARERAVLEENVRLALWRMDSAVASLFARENARPHYAYSAFYPAEPAHTRMFARIEPGEVLVPSPLLTQDFPFVRLHFTLDPEGRILSPQAPPVPPNGSRSSSSGSTARPWWPRSAREAPARRRLSSRCRPFRRPSPGRSAGETSWSGRRGSRTWVR